jgi:hypothetical protein
MCVHKEVPDVRAAFAAESQIAYIGIKEGLKGAMPPEGMMMLAAIIVGLAEGEEMLGIEVVEVGIGEVMILSVVETAGLPAPAPSVAIELMLDVPKSEVGTVAVMVTVAVIWVGQLLTPP